MRISLFGRSLLSIGPDRPEPLTATGLLAEARVAEEDGLCGYWVPQQFDLDAIGAVIHLAHHVPRIELGVGVLPLYERHPLLTAQQTLTAQTVTGGRFTLGLGLGHRFVVEGFWGGHYDRPVPTLREYLAVLLPLVRTGGVDFQGKFYRCASRPARLEPWPSTQVLLGAQGPRMLRLAGEVADGTLTWLCGPSTLRGHIVPGITRAADAAGRPAPRVVAALPVCVTDDPAAARRRIAVELRDYAAVPSHAAVLRREGAEDAGEVAVVGSRAQVLDRLAELAEAGVGEFAAVLHPADEREREHTRTALREAVHAFRPTGPAAPRPAAVPSAGAVPVGAPSPA